MVGFIRKIRQKGVLKLLFVVLVLITLIVAIQIPFATQSTPINDSSQEMETAYSTVIGSPDYLLDGSPVYENWNLAPQDYYYYSTVSSFDYELIYVYYQNSLYDMDLYLYSDSGFSNEIDNSMSGTQMEWLVYNPISGGNVYPMAVTDTSTGNTGYIETESGQDISVGSSISDSLSSSNLANLYEVPLYSNDRISVVLTLPGGCDFDLYVFRVSEGSCTQLDSHSSTSGSPVTLEFSPSYTDDYAIVVIRRSGSGTYTLKVQNARIPGFNLFWILLGTICALSICLVWLKKQNRALI